jgi:inosose dehydratase
VHLKDVDAAMARRVRAGEIGYRDAVRDGLYRPLGEGSAEIEAIVRLLTDSGYAGWYVIEQDLVIGAHIDASGPLENATRSVQFLQRVTSA